MLDGGGGYLSSGNQAFASQVGDTSAFWDPKGLGQGVGGASGAMGGGWLMPSLGIALKLLGMFGGKKAQNVLAASQGAGALGGAVAQLFGSNNPFEQNTTDKDKDKPIGGNNNLSSLGILGQAPLGAVGNAFGVGSMFS